MSQYCQNCGRKHEGRLIETFTDGDNKPIEIVVCDYPRYITKEEVDAMLANLEAGDGLWDIDAATLNSMADDIDARFGL